MSKDNFWRDVPEVFMVWHGEYSDPELEYNGKRLNYWDVEDSVYDYYKEQKDEPDEGSTYSFDGSDEDFDKFCQDHADYIYGTFEDASGTQKCFSCGEWNCGSGNYNECHHATPEEADVLGVAEYDPICDDCYERAHEELDDEDQEDEDFQESTRRSKSTRSLKESSDLDDFVHKYGNDYLENILWYKLDMKDFESMMYELFDIEDHDVEDSEYVQFAQEEGWDFNKANPQDKSKPFSRERDSFMKITDPMENFIFVSFDERDYEDVMKALIEYKGVDYFYFYLRQQGVIKPGDDRYIQLLRLTWMEK